MTLAPVLGGPGIGAPASSQALKLRAHGDSMKIFLSVYIYIERHIDRDVDILIQGLHRDYTDIYLYRDYMSYSLNS